MAKQKAGHQVSSNHLGRLKRYQQYFDQQKTYYLTPHSRSIPKKKSFFNQHSIVNNQPNKQNQKAVHTNNKSGKKQRKRKNSINGVGNMSQTKKTRRSNLHEKGSPSSKNKRSRYEHSIQKQYDSPSKDNQDMDLILADRPKIKKNIQDTHDHIIEKTIDQVYQQLTNNHLTEAITVLKQSLQRQPNNYDLNYLLGVCHLINGSYEQAIDIFDALLNRKPRKNIYLLLSVCYKKMEDYQETEKILNQCIKKNPKSYEACIYRGKLYLRLKKYKQAYNDFEKALKLNPDKQIGYIGKGDCLRLTERYDDAKAIYTKALHLVKKHNPSILLRRAICHMEIKRYDPAFDDIQQLLELDPQNSQALYFKGLIFNKQKMQNEAIICYQQAIKYNTNKKAVTRAIYELTKIKIQHRDYYEALYTLQRAKYLDIQERVVRKFRIFAEGATEMMKKNFEDGIKILSVLIDEDKQKSIGSFLRPLIYSCRSYGYMSLCKFQEAKQDFEKLERQYSMDAPNMYNKFICEGILSCNQQKYEQALAFFSKANKILPSRVQPYFYKAVTLISFISKLIPKQLVEKQQQYLNSALKTINKCEKSLESNHSLYLVKAFIHYAMGDLSKSLDNLQQSMKEPIKWQNFVFYLNGLILGEWDKHEEAVQQFKKVIAGTNSENKETKGLIPQVYLNKARCLLLINQVNSAFVDLQTYMTFRPSSPEIHIWAGHMLFAIGASEDAAKAYSNINNINKNSQVLMFRAKCYLSSKDVISTLSNLKQMLDIKYNNKIFFDYNILQSLRECSEEQAVDYKKILVKMKQTKQRAMTTGEGVFGELFSQSDYQFYKGVLYFYSKDYQKSVKNFKRSLKLTEEYIAENVEKNQELLGFYQLSENNVLYNYMQCHYNIALAQLMSGNIVQALHTLKFAIDKCPQDGKTKEQFQLFANLLQSQKINKFQNQQNQNNEQYSELYPFPFDNRLCSIFPQFVLPLKEAQIQTRLFFCLPRIEKPDLKPRFDSKLFDDINMSIIDIRPEAPWIKRSEQGVIFTDDVIGCQIELSQSEQSSSEEQEQDRYEREEDDQYDNNQMQMENASEGNEAPQVMDPRQLRDFFKLDPATEARLAKLKN